MKRLIALAALSLLAGCSEDIEKKVQPVTVEFLRAEYTKDFIDSMDESQFAGNSENTFNGGVELLDRLTEISTRVFPDGEYVAHIGTSSDVRNIPGYKFHCQTGWGGWKRNVYIKKESK